MTNDDETSHGALRVSQEVPSIWREGAFSILHLSNLSLTLISYESITILFWYLDLY